MNHFRLLAGFALVFLSGASAFAQTPTSANSGTAPTFKVDGLATLATNFLEYGLTQTDNDPNLQGQFWFNWGPQFRLGLWGSNVAFPNSESHFWLKLNADLKITFTNNADLTLSFSDGHFFKPESRNGNIIGLHLNLFGYGVNYDQIANFMGTENAATAFSFNGVWPVWTTWTWDNTIGYLQSGDTTIPNYFWLDTFLGVKPGVISYQGGLSYNSCSSNPRISGAGQPAFILKAKLAF